MPGYLTYELTGKPYQKSSFLHCDIMMLQDRLKGVTLGSPFLLSRDRYVCILNCGLRVWLGRTVRAVDLRMQKPSTTFQQIVDVEIVVKGIIT